MEIIYIFFCLFCFFSSQCHEMGCDDFILLDEIVALRVSESGLNPIFSSDCWFTNPFFGVKSIEQCVIDAALLSYAADHSMKKISDGAYKEYAEEYFDMLLSQKKISKHKIEEILQEYGSSIEEMRNLLNNQFIIQQTLEMFFASSGIMHVTDDEILEYYSCMNKENDDVYQLQIGELIADDGKYSLGEILGMQDRVKWGEICSVEKKNLKKSLYDCQVANANDIFYCEYDDAAKLYYVYKFLQVVPGKKKRLADLYDEINRKLSMMKYDEGYKKMIEELLFADNIFYINLEIQNKIETYINQ